MKTKDAAFTYLKKTYGKAGNAYREDVTTLPKIARGCRTKATGTAFLTAK